MASFRRVIESKTPYVIAITTHYKGCECYFIIEIEPSKVILFTKDWEKNTRLELEKYGRILLKGWGAAPPAPVRKELFTLYNLYHAEFA